MELLNPENFPDYQLIDSGNFMKLERFGKYILIRPEPQALWKQTLSKQEWQERADAEFIQKGSYSGEWNSPKNMPRHWQLRYKYKEMYLTFKLSLTGFKHVGIFPEQAVNWDYIYDKMREINVPPSADVLGPTFLNLFAYTGGASLAAKAAGADVVHVDSVKQVVSWARENMEVSKLDNIRWTIEDALKFVKREVKRGKIYHGIALDPPAYGIGANGERWKLEDQVNELIAETAHLLHPEHYCYVFNSYSLGFSSMVIQNLLDLNFPDRKNRSCGEIYLQSDTGPRLPLGVVGRMHS